MQKKAALDLQEQEKIKEATQKKAVLGLQEQVSEVGWKPLLDAAKDYLGNYPDDSEISQLAIKAEQGYREEADRLLAQKEFEKAVDAYQDLGDEDKAISALLAQWRHQMSKSTRKHLAWFAALLGVSGAIAFILVNIELSTFFRYLLFVTGSITLLCALYLLCLLLFSDLLMRWRLQKSLEKQLQIDLPIAEVKRRIHNTEYIRPILASRLGWGGIYGSLGVLTFTQIAVMNQFIPKIFQLPDSLTIFIIFFLIGGGLGTRSPLSSSDTSVSHLRGEDGFLPIGCGFSMSIPILVISLIGVFIPVAAPVVKYVMWFGFGMGIVVSFFVAIAARDVIRQVTRRQLVSEQEE
jgi:hypothetical protein